MLWHSIQAVNDLLGPDLSVFYKYFIRFLAATL